MRELRLVPAAASVWAATLAVVLGWPLVALGVVGAVVVAAALRRHVGQALVVAATGGVALAVALVRQARAARFSPTGRVEGELQSAPVALDSGGWLLRLDVDGVPGTVPVFSESLPTVDGFKNPPAGTRVAVEGTVSESNRPGVVEVVINGDAAALAAPQGWAGWAAGVTEKFQAVVLDTVGPASQGLLPGMVLGDVGLQDAAERALYIETGLSHLSAVSGANVVVVTAAAALVARWARASPRGQVLSALGALAVFVALVGAEPSVLRAGVTGLVGLLAVVNSSRMEPVHGLCLAIIGLLWWDTELAVNYGFALSVAATAGIVALQLVFYRWLAPLGLPDLITRAFAVAVAADIVTIPIVALMAGEVSVVSIVANVAVAPATAPVTVVGLAAAIAVNIPGIGTPLAGVLLKVIEPCTWWINSVAHAVRDLPLAVVSTGPVAVALVYGWVVAGFLFHRPRLTVTLVLSLAAVLGIAGSLGHAPAWLQARGGARVHTSAPEVNLADLRAHVVDTDDDIEPVPPGTQVIVVLSGEGPAADRPTRTPDYIPVLYPARDGPVRVYVDGTQHAVDGRF
ncbi:ComEC/Rec2 family competence protein [Corynebacterium sp. LK2532]|uniref:ComEC/Rec2 family competence protein n=1 Tax=unclassified Corynebacterium TaxID=2624378 RepID=UPI0034CD2AE3